jgi:hypothetical protein
MILWSLYGERKILFYLNIFNELTIMHTQSTYTLNDYNEL